MAIYKSIHTGKEIDNVISNLYNSFVSNEEAKSIIQAQTNLSTKD